MADDDFNDGRILIHTHHNDRTGQTKNMSTAHVRMRTCSYQYTHNNFTLCSMVRIMTDSDNGQCLVAAASVTMPYNDAVIFHPLLYRPIRSTVYPCWIGMRIGESTQSFILPHFEHHISLSLSHTLTPALCFSRPHVSNLFLYILWVRFCCWQFLFPLFLFFLWIRKWSEKMCDAHQIACMVAYEFHLNVFSVPGICFAP